MAITICSKHLRVLNLLNFTEGNNLDFLENFLELSRANLNVYLKDLYSSIPDINKTNKIDLMIKEILNCNDLFSILKKQQVISKNERVFFLTLKLLVKGSLNLETLSKKLDVSRRTVNGDLTDIKKDLENFQLIIESHTGKGVFLTGENINRKRALSCYIYKYLIEEQYLPPIFIDYFHSLIHNSEIDTFLLKDIEKLLTLSNMDNFFCNRELLKAFYISFKYFDDLGNNYNNTFGNILKDFSIFNFYFSKLFSNDDLNSFYNILHHSLFKDIDFNEIPYFLNILKICTGSFPEEAIYFEDHLISWNAASKKILNRHLTSKEELALKKIILRVGFSSRQKHYIPVQEFLFFNLNIEKEIIHKCISLFTELKQYYWNLSFNDIVSVFFIMNCIKEDKKEVVVVYKDVPRYIVENLKDRLEYKYNIFIKDFVTMPLFENFKKNNSVKTVGVFTELNFDTNDFEVIKLDLNL
ncbi:HTH domain-containing protein (plasmid) [Cetobacterium somerae]|uniref:HTH domain-containing protein n=1 Tax=Cetobacterium somerae TaxID=188913 RepID=UPI001F06E1D6|nr:HTH domain-containing protein [Cetobacterium somerae]UPO98512.1 HTH domain-containing protein [Cetobacterium somerae]